MGQKVHPLGFRVGITKKHQSQWFARFNKYKYEPKTIQYSFFGRIIPKIAS